MIQYADIALNIPFKTEETLTYQIPEGMNRLQIGCRVEVELRKRKMEGVVIGVHFNMPTYEIKNIKRQIDKEPVVNSEQIQLAYWMRDFYVSTLGESLYKMIPTGRKNQLSEPVVVDSPELLTLNDEQLSAYEKIKADFGNEKIHLLYGITGSGKTEVYIHLLNHILKNTDKSAILLVPEISLTFQILYRLELIFGKQLALLHSNLRQVAQQRIKINKATLLLGSATPSLESFYYAKKGVIVMHRLSKRAKSSGLSTVQVVSKKEDKELVGEDLLFKIKQRLERKEQVVLLLNRRGYSPLIYNRKEKKFIECPNCTSNLCYHSKGKAICHLCGYSEKYQKIQKEYPDSIELMGAGTQKLEEYLLEKFPGVRLERLDQDSTKKLD